ncbi:hypothetical protein [Streptomyces sp. NPDC059757]|uniref:hypothetical protein n=1 Tax=unclassified Streptomyces TaxID=2593676 RepID=UPI00365D72F3
MSRDFGREWDRERTGSADQQMGMRVNDAQAGPMGELQDFVCTVRPDTKAGI